jgi:hypothetical protein
MDAKAFEDGAGPSKTQRKIKGMVIDGIKD